MITQSFLFDITNPQQPRELTETFVLGSDPQCQWQLKADGVQERHCRLENKGTQFLIRDLRSGAPTYVNGTQISEAYLNEGDEIQLGESRLIFTQQSHEAEKLFCLKSKNPEWQKTLTQMSHVSQTDYPVLLLGPSGTGKEVISQAIHEHSKRSLGPFVSVNCSALTETLIESELFGHTKGSFTGAISDRKGAFESARMGTLFLDEIGDLPYGMQAKLLRALENNEIRPVGSDRSIQTDVRIIAATHQNLHEKIRAGQFRADLYYRLNVICVRTPSLNERLEDFEDLLYTFAKKMRVRFSFNAIQKLKKHNWAGNVRELRNTVARASAFFPRVQIEESHLELIVDRSLQSSDVPAEIPDGQLPVIKEIERQMIIKRLVANRGNQRRTASDLGMPKSTLHDRLKFYQIDPKSYGLEKISA